MKMRGTNEEKRKVLYPKILEAQRMYDTGKYTQPDLAKHFNVSLSTIRQWMVKEIPEQYK